MPRGRREHEMGLGSAAGPRRISRFLEPCLLVLLREDASDGSSLLEALRQFGFAPGMVDASVIYRILREMDDAGWVSSRWNRTSSGPPRRVYTVTTDGREYLAAWISELRSMRDEIDQFIELYARQASGQGSGLPEKQAGVA